MIASLRQHSTTAIAVAVVVLTALIVTAWSASAIHEEHYSSQLSLYRPPPFTAPSEQGPEITRNTTLGASFVATEDRLSEVDILFSTFNRKNTGKLVFSLATSLDGEPLLTIEVRTDNFPMDRERAFAFEPIPDSVGQTYYLTLSSPDATPGNAVTAYLGNCNCDPDGDVYINGQRQPDRDLVMSQAYRVDTKGFPWELVNRVSQFKPEVFKGVGFLLLVIATAALVLIATGLYTRRVVSEPPAEPEFPWRWVLASLPFLAYVANLIWFRP